MKIENIGRIVTLCFVALLPWSVIFSVFGTERLHLDIARYFKEIFLGVIGILYIYEIIKRKLKITFDTIDWAIL
jgi:hypothetical protein